MASSHDILLSRLIAGLLAGIALQSLNVLAFSAAGLLEWSWCFSVFLGAAFAIWCGVQCRRAEPTARGALAEAWTSPWPWVFALLLLLQISLYPPTMSDSLCYRLPRIFLALQEGSIGRFITPDYRMNGMTWGWEMMATPFAALNQLSWSRLVNLGTWLLAYQLLFSWARPVAQSATAARRVALALATAPVFLLQAVSTANDLYAGGLLMAGACMILFFHRNPSGLPVLGSLLALVLAANAKPQFFVLGLPWLLWWFFAPGKPWRQLPWWALALACPFYVLVSPLPQLATNLWIGGGMLGIEDTGKAAPWLMSLAGLLQFSSAQFQLPLFPGAESFSHWLNRFPGFDALHRAVPKFGPGVSLIPQIDNASFGLIHTLVAAAGFLIALRRGSVRACVLWLLTVIAALVISASQVVPSTSGRAFMGFGVLLYPVAAMGLAASRHTTVAWGLRLACIAGALAMILNPSAPLWPSRQMENFAKKHSQPAIVAKLEKYHAYQERAQTGLHILDPVPAGSHVAVLMRGVTPASNLWAPDWKARSIEYVHEVDAASFARSSYDWLLIGANAAEQFPELHRDYQLLASSWDPVKSATYLHTIRQGPEDWTLYRRPAHD